MRGKKGLDGGKRKKEEVYACVDMSQVHLQPRWRRASRDWGMSRGGRDMDV